MSNWAVDGPAGVFNDPERNQVGVTSVQPAAAAALAVAAGSAPGSDRLLRTVPHCAVLSRLPESAELKSAPPSIPRNLSDVIVWALFTALTKISCLISLGGVTCDGEKVFKPISVAFKKILRRSSLSKKLNLRNSTYKLSVELFLAPALRCSWSRCSLRYT